MAVSRTTRTTPSTSRTTPRAAASAPAEFNVVAELGDVADAALLAGSDWASATLDALVGYGPVISRSPYGRLEAILTLPASDLAQATRTALAVLADVRRPDGSPLPAYSLQVLLTAAFDHRTRFVEVPPLLSVPQAATALGISRQAVLKRIETGALPASRIGSVWGVAAAAMPSPLDDDEPGDPTSTSAGTDGSRETRPEASEAVGPSAPTSAAAAGATA